MRIKKSESHSKDTLKKIPQSSFKHPEIHSSEFLNTIIANIPYAVFVKDRKHRWVFLNQAFSTLLGYPLSKMLGKFDYDFFPKGQADLFWKKGEETFRTGIIADIPNVPITDKNGLAHRIHMRQIPITDSLGKITHLMGVIEDITEIKLKEGNLILKQQIARQHARLLDDLRSLHQEDEILTRVCGTIRDSGLFERAMMTVYDESGHLTHLGQVGLPRKLVELARKAPPLDRKQINRMTSERFRISDSFFIPVEAGFDFRKSGRYIPQKKATSQTDWRLGDELFIPLRDFSRKITGYLSADTPRDGCRPNLMKIQFMEMLVEAAASRIREIKIHNSLKQECDYSQAILETANSIIVCLDGEANIRVFNREAERVTGYRREEVLGKSWLKIFLPKENRHSGLKNFARWVRAHPSDRYEGSIITKSGEVRHISWSNSAILHPKESDLIALAIGQDVTLQKRVDRTLQAIGERLSYLQSITPAIIYSCRPYPPYHYTFIGENIRSRFGYEPEQFTKDPKFWIDRVHPEDRERILAGLEQTALKGYHILEYRFRHGDGTYRWVYDENRVVRDRKGNPKEMAGHFIDITARKRAEEALGESEERFRQLGENIDLAFWLTDWRSKKLLYVNPSYEKIFGRSRRSAYENRLDWYQLIHPDDRSRVRNLLVKNTQLGKNTEVEYRIIRDDGTMRNILDRSYPIRDKHGEVHRVASVATDITARKQMEQALRENVEKYETLVENASDQIFMINGEYKLVSANRAVAKLFRKKTNQIMGKPISKIFPKEIAEKNIDNLNRVFKTKKPLLVEEKLIVGRHEFWASTSLNPVKDDTGRVIAVLGVVRDFSQRKKLEEEKHQIEDRYRLVVDHANEAIMVTQGRFLRFINPKTAEIIGYSEKELLSRPFAEHIHPDDRKMVLTRHSQRIEGKEIPSIYEFRIIDRKGKIKWLEINAVRIMWENKPATLDFLTEITERKEAERRQDEYREQKTLYELMRSLSMTSNMEGLLDIAAEKTTELLGMERCTIVLLNEDGKSATLKAIHERGRSLDPRLLGYVFTPDIFPQLRKTLLREPIVLEDVSALPETNWTRSFFEGRGIKSTLAVPLVSRGKFIGSLAISTTNKPYHYTEEEIRLLQIIANPIAAAIENTMLLEVITRHTQELRELTSELMKTQEKEQDRLAKELHDQVGQMLQAMKINLDRIRRDMPDHPKMEFARDRLVDTGKLLAETIEEIRSLSFALRPATLDDFGLAKTLKWYVDDYARRSGTEIVTQFEDENLRYSSEIETNLFRIIQESLNNVLKHASATKVTISFSQKDSTLILSIADNGKGFDVNKTLGSSKKGTGILNMKERVGLLSGNFQIISRPKKGTEINIKIPLVDGRD